MCLAISSLSGTFMITFFILDNKRHLRLCKTLANFSRDTGFVLA